MSAEQWMRTLSPGCRALPRFSALAEAVLCQAADLAALAESLPAAWSLGSAVGVQLDALGDSLGQTRAGREDAAYRAFLLGKLALWRWEGTNEGVPQVLAVSAPGAVFADRMDGFVAADGDPALLPIPAGVGRIPIKT